MNVFAYLRAIFLFPLNLEKLMATQAELAVTLNNLSVLMNKIKAETQGLVAEVAALKEAVEAAQTVSPEVAQALATLQAHIGEVDAIVPDAAEPEEPGEEEPEEPGPEEEEDGGDETAP